MSTEETLKYIDLYFDGELEKTSEAFLFTRLSQDEKAREYFKKQHLLKSSIQETVEPFPGDLEERIFRSIGQTAEKGVFSPPKRKSFGFVYYAVTSLMIAISLFFYSQNSVMEDTIEESLRQLEKQNKLINILYNSLPSAEVTTTVDYNVIVTDKM